MLDFAKKYEGELDLLFVDTYYKEEYKYYNYFTYYKKCEISDSTWTWMEYVSLDNEGKTIGFISYYINRETGICDTLSIINFRKKGFNKDNVIFIKDLMQVIDDMFFKFNFKKLKFSVAVGNPSEKGYDRFIKKHNGRVVGISYKNLKLFDGKYYDEKYYEIFREDYIESRKGDNQWII